MATGLGDDGSEDVNDFLARIRELGDQKDRDEEERNRKLEEDIVKARQERAARRAERARSISPNKDSSAPIIGATAGTRSVADTPTLASAMSPVKQVLDAPASGPLALEPSKPDPVAHSTLTRSNTLSWQQRGSRASTTVRSRPMSVIATENSVFRSPSATPEPTASQEKEDIPAQSHATSEIPEGSNVASSAHPMASMLSDKDPSWFRQNAERSKGSAALRKSQEPEIESVSRSGSVRMPGMSGRDERSKNGSETPGSIRQRPKSTMDEVTANLDSVRLDPPNDESDASSSFPAMSPSQGRISPERPSSPTKGLGGFVQSAMLKRSDSVTKRWSATTPTGLQRGNSIAGNRTSRDLGTSLTLRAGNARTPSPTKEQIVPDQSGIHPGSTARTDAPRGSKSPPPETSTSRPSSPTKDTRRWSPVKSSWLENAINKPEPSKQPKPATSQQPAWMQELQKAKAARASVDIGKPGPGPSEPSQIEALRGDRYSSKLQTEDKPALPAKPALHEPTGLVLEETEEETTNKSEMDLDQEPNQPEIPKEKPTVKPKPETPPKTDFRSGLKQRSVDNGKAKAEEPEFKKAFGNLRRAETKNYKAPDTLKSNIMRGKAGLSVTGGPQKTERVDEFKESILARKKEFAAAPTKPPAKNPSQDIDKPVPEALAKRTGMLNRTKSIGGGSNETANGKFTTENPVKSETTVVSRPSPAPPVQSKNSALSSRFNPALAGLLARGPPAASATSSSPERPSGTGASSLDMPTGKGPELTHTTKGRARGPKRKPPSSNTNKSAPGNQGGLYPAEAASTSIATSSPEVTAAQSMEDKIRSYNQIKTSLVANAEKIDSLGIVGTERSMATSPVVERETSQTPAISSRLSVTARPKPPAPKSPSNRVSSNSYKPSAPVSTTQAVREEETSSPAAKSSTRSPVASKLSTPAKASTAGSVSLSAKSSPVVTPKPKPPSPELKRASVRASTFDGTQPSTPSSKVVTSSVSTSPDIARVRPLPQVPSPKPSSSPAIPAKSATARSFSSPKPATTAIDPSADSARQVVRDFFGDVPPSKTPPSIDTGAILQMAARNPGKIRTLRKQIWEFTSDGKRAPLATQQEYILFEDCMYFIAHVFGSAAGKHSTEAYVWVGDAVPPSAVEDAQLFARNAAKEVGATGKLVVMQQGKETSNFFEALGGIVIIRKGSSKDSSATYMLCGRKHLGQMAFDEVPFGSQSLCSGFPFIISATGGSLYLWKGKGSGADELGCARLIAMDLGLTGDIKEIDDGAESDDFWESLRSSDSDKSRSSGHWPLKAKKETYVTRLFVVDDTRPRSAGLGGLWGLRANTPAGDEPGTADIHEISPFAQNDLSQDGIYVLDAFFEVYVSALYFAQEYAILVASGEDRPFVPTSYVVFAGANPTYLKTAFRKWDDSRVTTQPIGSTSSSASTLPLHAVIAATIQQ